MSSKQATATINKEVDVIVGNPDCYETYLVGFTITANINTGSEDSRDTPGEPPSVDEWVDLKIGYILSKGYRRHPLHPVLTVIFKKHILDLAEAANMEWVDEYDEDEPEENK